MTISNDTAALIGFGCEAFFFGCYTVLFVLSAYLMHKRTCNRSGFTRPIFVISILLYFSCATHFALEFNHFYSTLVTTGVHGFADETKVLVGADILISVTDFFGQIILLYRCWLLWSRKYWIIILPTLMSMGGVACIAVVIHSLLSIDPSSPIAPSSLVPLGLAGFILPLCTNVLVTALITARIWLLSPHRLRDLRRVHIPQGMGRVVIGIVIESGALYLVVQLVFVVLFAIHHPAQGIVGVIAVQIYGIAPALIIIRVALGMSNPLPGRSGASGARPASSAAPTEVRIGYSMSAFSDAGQHVSDDTRVHIAHAKSKPDGEDRHSGYSTEDAV